MNRHLNGKAFRRIARLLVTAFALTMMLLADLPASAAPATKSSTAKKATSKKTTTARKASTKKKTSARNTTASRKKTTRKKVTAKKRTASRGARRTTRRRSAKTTRARVPMQPTSERLTEVQTALASAGYLERSPNGKWDDSSIAAMKRFQQEHSIPATGKINSLSLIALGLGPKRGPSPGNTSVLSPTTDESKTDTTQQSNR